MELLTNTVQRYDWGSSTAIPRLLGVEPDWSPQAELWMGTHPVAPSRLADGRTLDTLISSDPAALLGPAVYPRLGEQLPFLLKVLAADRPLSIQAHPSQAIAAAGFAREEAAGIALTDPHRSYKDPNHKPELICALTDFEALCGFREVADSVELLTASGNSTLALWAGQLAAQGLSALLGEWLTLDPGSASHLSDLVAEAAGPLGLPWIERIADRYPGDVGVAVAALLHHVVLQPGQALYLGAGNLHAYLQGVGVEVMASSDNVLRGGLTSKHVDVWELLRVVDTEPLGVDILTPDDNGVYRTPAQEFELQVLPPDSVLEAGRPSIVLCTEGEVQLGPIILLQGQSCFVAANDPAVKIGVHGAAYRATVPA
ncbi:MAG: Mannose-6-phosphate isomerase [Acidimicrobiia bacterium]|nr:Mannose-6-phosphate isomerase [Acidimicrobiia bacterium]